MNHNSVFFLAPLISSWLDFVIIFGRIFGGLIQDVKRRAPHYLSDFKDALHLQCVASFIFMYFACITPVITFGGLLGEATNNMLVCILFFLFFF